MITLTRTSLLLSASLLSIGLAGLSLQASAQKCPQPLAETVFEAHKKQLEQESFEEDRMKMATSFLKQKRCLKVSQIKRVIKLFNFEDNQMTFAKMAYQYVHDPENYQEVISVFTEAPYRKTLTKFISKRK